MKEYTPPRLLECHHQNEDGDPIPCPGLCPKLVIKSAGLPGNPQLGPDTMHAIVFTESEVRTLVREADRGYFDLPNMPERKDSRFWDPLTSLLIQSLQENPIRALGILMFLGQPGAIAFTADPEPMLALRDADGGWLWIHLDAPMPLAAPEPAAEDGSDNTEVEVPTQVSYHDTPPDTATILWERTETEETRYDLTDNGNAAIDAG